MFGVIEDFYFSRISNFTREFCTKKYQLSFSRFYLHGQLLVKIWLKSAHSFLRYNTWQFNKQTAFRENLLTHTQFFIYQSILLKFSGYVRNTYIHLWWNFELDRTFFSGVIKDFGFTRKFASTREYYMEVANSHLPRSHSNCKPLVKIWSKSTQRFLRYEAWQTDRQTDRQKDKQTYTLTAKLDPGPMLKRARNLYIDSNCRERNKAADVLIFNP